MQTLGGNTILENKQSKYQPASLKGATYTQSIKVDVLQKCEKPSTKYDAMVKYS